MALAYYDDEHPQNSIAKSVKAGLSKFAGVIFLAIAFVILMMLLTHSVDDPSIFNGTETPATNAFGILGAQISAILLQLFGRGAYLLPLALTLWAGRAIIGLPTGHVMSRMLFLIPALPACAAWAATHSVADGWFLAGLNGTGMGGDWGDKILGGFISLLPFGAHFSLFIASVFFAILAGASAAFVSGFHLHEINAIASKIKTDTIVFYNICQKIILNIINKFRGRTTRISAQNLAPAAPKIFSPQAPSYREATQQSHQEQAPSSRFGRKSATIRLPKISSLLAIFQTKARPISARATATEPVNTGNLGTMSLSDRIKALANQNVADHQTLLKRRFNTNEPEAFNTDASEYPQNDHLWSAPDPMDAIYQEVQSEGQTSSVTQKSVVQPTQMNASKPSQKSVRDAQPSFMFEVREKQFEMPSLSMLANPDNITRHVPPREALEASAKQLMTVLEDYGVKGEIVAVRPGPVVTMYELEPNAGLKASRVIGLADDIARSMAAITARVSTIPGRSVIGIELPNEIREVVLLREIFTAKDYGDSRFPLPLALGKDIFGEPVVANLAKMPHLLIAGTTGSGKSVAINTMILSLLYHAKPEDVRMIMIDPKMLELSVYDDIPHLLSPVVTDPKKAVVALKWTVGEMEERYRKMSKMGVRNIDGYNARVEAALQNGEGFKRTVQTGFDDITGEPIFETDEYAPEKMPYIVVIVDEMADLMMVSGKEIEACIQRLAQMARASGIHLIMATQRPSVDVITGTIKANFPTRISFQVTSKIDSRTILGEMGAEQLLGQGDMLYMSGGGRVMRVHGPFVSDTEVEEIVTHLKAQGEPVYESGVLEGPEEEKGADIDAVLGLNSGSEGDDQLYDQAVMIVARDRKCSTSYIQRKLSVGYNKAATIVERMEEEGVVSAANHVGKREILVPEIN